MPKAANELTYRGLRPGERAPVGESDVQADIPTAIVEGFEEQTADLQQWVVDGEVLASVDALGNLSSPSVASTEALDAVSTVASTSLTVARASAGADLGSQAARSGLMSIPALERVGSGPIMTGTDATVQKTIYWFDVIYVADLIDDPIDAYYGFYSTDHDSSYGGTGGLFLATAPAITGPYTKRNADGSSAGPAASSDNGTPVAIWPENVELETPSLLVVDDDPDGRFLYVYMQDKINGQATVLLTSDDGLSFSWERAGKLRTMGQTYNNSTVADTPVADPASYTNILSISQVFNSQSGGLHSGYFNPFRVGDMFYGYGLYGTGDYAEGALWASVSAREWMVDPNPLGYQSAVVLGDSPRRKWSWNQTTPVRWHNSLWAFGSTTTFGSDTDVLSRQICAAPLADSLRQLAKPVDILPDLGDGPGESLNLRSQKTRTDRDGSIYVFYQCDMNLFVARVKEVA